MKNLFFALAFCSIILVSCGDDDEDPKTCYKCTLSILGIETSDSFCDEGANTVVTTEVLGISANRTATDTTATEYKTYVESLGYTCVNQ